MKKSDIYKSAGIIIKERKLLVTKAYDKDIFIAPGGRIEEGETSKEALIRELYEELLISVDETSLTLFGTFTAKAAGQEEITVTMDVYTLNGWHGDPTPSMEVEEMKWVDSNDLISTNIGSIFAHDVIPKLKEQNLID